jgi:drug/metabolite transporter (DMT)-like permease
MRWIPYALLCSTFARISVSIGAPTIRVMGILIARRFGILLLHEPFTWRYLLGLLLTVPGVALIVFR